MAENNVQIKITAEDLASSVVKGLSTAMKTAFGDIQSAAMNIAHIGQSIQYAWSSALGAIQPVIDGALQAEKLQAMFNSASGSAVLAANDMKFATTEATRLGLGLIATAESFASFTASAKGSSLQGDETKRIFSSVAEASSVMRLSTEQTNRMFLALSQMMSKGTVQAEELKGQLGERLPGAFQMAAKAMGLTTAELQKQLEVGGIMASDLLPKLATELHNTYGPQAAESAKSLQGQITLLANALKQASMDNRATFPFCW